MRRLIQSGFGLIFTVGFLLAHTALAATEKIVLAEDFTATWCGDCPNARCALEMMLNEFGDQFVVAEHHMMDILDNDWTNARAAMYDVGPIPHVQFDGKVEVVGARTCTEAAAAYRQAIQQRLVETGGISPLAITGRWWRDDVELSLSATFRLEDPASLPSVDAFLLALEDDIVWQGQTYNHVTRAVFSQPVVLSAAGDSVTVTAGFPLEPPWDLSRFECIAFLQRADGNHEIYQAARLTATNDCALDFDRASVSLPRTHGLAVFSATVRNTLPVYDYVTITLENEFGWHADFGIEGLDGYRTDPVVLGLESGEQRAVTLRVFAGYDERVGAGYVATHSAATTITRRHLARVWNGSPSILVVDDDYVDPTERLITNSLAASGYLYDVWNVCLQHLNQSPSSDTLHDYDVIIWHHGWMSTSLLTSGEITNLMSYMDAGGRLILSSQDLLSTVSPGAFTRDYLGAQSWTANVGATQALGVGGDPVGDGFNLLLSYPSPAYNRADDAEPSAVGSVILESEAGRRIALRADNGSGRSVFYAFAINAIDSLAPPPNNVAKLLDRSIAWLLSPVNTDVVDAVDVGPRTPIRCVAPNPSAPSAHGAAIRILLNRVETGRPLRLRVLDASGRIVREYVCAEPVRELVWDGRTADGHPAPSGCYYLHVPGAEWSRGPVIRLVR